MATGIRAPDSPVGTTFRSQNGIGVTHAVFLWHKNYRSLPVAECGTEET